MPRLQQQASDLNSPDAQQDLADVQAIAADDRAAFARLVTRYEQPVLQLARALCGGQLAAAEDVLQDTFLAVFQHAHSFRAEGSVRAWILTITRHAASHYLRKTHPNPPQIPTDDPEPLDALGVAAGWGASPDPAQHENNNPEHNVALLEQHRALQRALLSLDDTDRLVIGLRDLQGLSGPEAASLSGLSLNTFKTRLHRARLRLMAALRTGDSHGA